MKKLTVNKFSILAIVLTAVSAITVVFSPSKARSDSKAQPNGFLVDSSGTGEGDLTCRTWRADDPDAPNCDRTQTAGILSSTSNDSVNSDHASEPEIDTGIETTV